MNPYIVVILLALAPITEIRGAMPVALQKYNLPLGNSLAVALAANLAAGLLVFLFLTFLADYLRHHNYWVNRFLAWLFERTRRKQEKKFAKWGALALTLFVAIPLPLTGAWSGAVAAFVFGLPLKKTALAMFFGIIISGLIASAITISVFKIL